MTQQTEKTQSELDQPELAKFELNQSTLTEPRGVRNQDKNTESTTTTRQGAPHPNEYATDVMLSKSRTIVKHLEADFPEKKTGFPGN